MDNDRSDPIYRSLDLLILCALRPEPRPRLGSADRIDRTSEGDHRERITAAVNIVRTTA